MVNITQNTLGNIGEYQLHRRILGLIGETPSLINGIGDDACVIPVDEKKGIAICCDIVPSGLKGRYAGKFAVAHNYSDLLSVGARPKGILVSLSAPSDLPVDSFDELIMGVKEEAAFYKTKLLGGDTKEKSEYNVVGIGVGIVDLENILTRSNAKVGDIVAVTNTTSRGWGRRWAHKVCLEIMGEKDLHVKNLLIYQKNDLFLPFKEMLALTASKAVNAAIDCSDGLAASCKLISKSSGVGIKLFSDKLIEMLAPETIQTATYLSINPLAFCFTPGYDWECLLTIPKSKIGIATNYLEATGGCIVEIGIVTAGSKMELQVDENMIPFPQVGDMKFSPRLQYNSPKTWISFAHQF